MEKEIFLACGLLVTLALLICLLIIILKSSVMEPDKDCKVCQGSGFVVNHFNLAEERICTCWKFKKKK